MLRSALNSSSLLTRKLLAEDVPYVEAWLEEPVLHRGVSSALSRTLPTLQPITAPMTSQWRAGSSTLTRCWYKEEKNNSHQKSHFRRQKGRHHHHHHQRDGGGVHITDDLTLTVNSGDNTGSSPSWTSARIRTRPLTD